MKRERGGGEESRPPRRSFTEIAEEVCPWYMAIGMSYDEFWNGDVWLKRDYRKAYEWKREMRNEELWLQGRYIYEAVGALAPILRAFSKAKKPEPYPKRPYPVTETAASRLEESKRKREEAEFYAYMDNMMSDIESAFKEREKSKEVTESAGQRADARD